MRTPIGPSRTPRCTNPKSPPPTGAGPASCDRGSLDDRRSGSPAGAPAGREDLLQHLLVRGPLLQGLPQLDDGLLGRQPQRLSAEPVDRLDLLLGVEKLVAPRPALRDI